MLGIFTQVTVNPRTQTEGERASLISGSSRPNCLHGEYIMPELHSMTLSQNKPTKVCHLRTRGLPTSPSVLYSLALVVAITDH